MVSFNSIQSLEIIKAKSSGLDEFKRSKFTQELSYIQDLDASLAAEELATRLKTAPFLHLFLIDKHEELKDLLISDPSLIALAEIKSLKLLNLLILGETLSLKDFFPLAIDKNSVNKRSVTHLSKHLLSLYSAIYLNTEIGPKFKEIKLQSLEEFLPGIAFRYAEFVLRYRIANQYSAIWEILSPYAEIENFDDSNLEAARLLAIYKRLQGDLIGAEKYSYIYHKNFKPDLEKRSRLITHANNAGFPAETTLKHWSEILAECDEIQSAIIKQAGLENNTCEYFACTDCCTHTFPVMSYTEFLYLKDWLIKNKYPIEELKQKCNDIQAQYETQYGTRLKVLDRNLAQNNIRGIENPHDFKYSCPFLSADGRCSCYAARPLLCRGFGLSTDNGISIKSCQYYITQYQHGTSADTERDVYDLRQVQSLARASDKYLSKSEDGIEKNLSGTIIAWFSDEENSSSV